MNEDRMSKTPPTVINSIPISPSTDEYIEKLQQENMKLKQQTELFAEKNSKLTKQHERDMDKLKKMEHSIIRKSTKLQKVKDDIDRAYYCGGNHALLAINNMELQDTEQALFAIKNMELQILEQKSEDVKAQTGVDEESLHDYRSDQTRSQCKENINLNNTSLETKNSKKRKRKKALDIRMSSYKIATDIQRFRKLHLRGDNNLCEDTCNGEVYLNLCSEGNKIPRPDDFDDLSDFLVCKRHLISLCARGKKIIPSGLKIENLIGGNTRIPQIEKENEAKSH